MTEFFSTVEGVAETWPILESKNCLPKWVAQARLDYRNSNKMNSHIARCPGIIDVLTTGYIITAWHDIYVQAGDDIVSYAPGLEIEELLGKPPLQTQSGDSLAKHLPKRPWSHKHILKINTPWHIKSKQKFLMIPLPYTDEFVFESCTGILDPSISSEINIQGYINASGNINIRAGTPLAQLIPIGNSDNKLTIRDMNKHDAGWIKRRKFLNNMSFVLNKGKIKDAYHRYFG